MEAFAALFGPLYCPEEHLDLYHEEPGEDVKEQCPAVLDDELLPLLEVHRAKEGPVLAAEGISLGRVWENRGRSTGSKLPLSSRIGCLQHGASRLHSLGTQAAAAGSSREKPEFMSLDNRN